jgi:multidrug resistance protein, MATE family
VLAFDLTGRTPAGLLGAPGYWAASTAGLSLAMVLLLAVVWQVMRAQRDQPRSATVA